MRGGRRDLNPQQPEPQSGALPLSYDHHTDTENESSPSSNSAKEIFAGDKRTENNCNNVPITYARTLIQDTRALFRAAKHRWLTRLGIWTDK
jgi:hypothetical protein